MPVFPPNIITAAQRTQAKYGCPASVCLAQWALESNWGQRMSGKNNPFGIKATGTEPSTAIATHEVIRGVSTPVIAKFADYSNIEDSFDAHGRLLARGSAYVLARTKLNDPNGYAHALTGHYATDPLYGSKLITIMKSNNLYEYDVPNSIITSTTVKSIPPTIPHVSKPKVVAAGTAVVAGTAAIVSNNYTAGIVLAVIAVIGVAVFLYLHFKRKS